MCKRIIEITVFFFLAAEKKKRVGAKIFHLPSRLFYRHSNWVQRMDFLFSLVKFPRSVEEY